jgi:hypothetical protein
VDIYGGYSTGGEGEDFDVEDESVEYKEEESEGIDDDEEEVDDLEKYRVGELHNELLFTDNAETHFGVIEDVKDGVFFKYEHDCDEIVLFVNVRNDVFCLNALMLANVI